MSGADPAPLERVHRPVGPFLLGATIGGLRHGGQDPTFRVVGGTFWLGQATPAGPATLALTARPTDGSVRARAWGEGAQWSLEHVPDLLGAGDDPRGFVPHHDVVARAWRSFGGWRVPRSHLVVQSLVPACIEQRVTGKEAFAGHARLVRRFGTAAPGPGADLGLYVPPAPRAWATIPSWEWLQAGVDRSRSAPVMRAAQVAGRLEECAGLPLPAAHTRLRAIPGVGEWTAAETAQRALGDADAVSFGDYHVAKDIGFALTGTPVDDDGLRELLEPYAGHRFRVQGLLGLAGIHRPRRGPRMTLPTHLPTRR